MAAPETKCTLHALVARDGPAAVIYRRGPSRQTCLIAWNRADDTFQVGQWFKGMVKPSWGGLSPDGRWLVTFMGKHTGPFGTWTVLSRPPYFTAVSLWPLGHSWAGGGWFPSDRTMVLAHGAGPYALGPGFLPPPGLTVRPQRDLGERLEREGSAASPWLPAGDRERWTGPHGHALIRRWDDSGWRGGAVSLDEAVLHELHPSGGPVVALPRSGWAAFDRNGDVLFSGGGRLFRLGADAIAGVTSSAGLTEAARCLADFSDLRFAGVRAPYDTPHLAAPDSETGSAFAPRLDRTTREERRAAKRARRLATRRDVTGSR